MEKPELVQFLAPGFEIKEAPLQLTNINFLRYRHDGVLVAGGYNGKIYLLRDTDGDGVEDSSSLYWESESIRAIMGMAVTPKGDARGDGVFVAAWPYARLPREDFDAVLRMLTAGFTPRRGPRAAYIHRDAANSQLRARRGARLSAISSGGAIPDNADYQVILEPNALMVGSVHEDFAVESMAGDIFQLGNISYRVLRVEQGKLRVESAAGLPPTVPFWLGEATGRSDALSLAISRLREQAQVQLLRDQQSGLQQWLIDVMQLDLEAATQLAEYLTRTHLALGLLPTQDTLVMERFFDESGGTQLVIHSPYGSRFNRAWGLALRKRFCMSFDFVLQAAATDDAVLLSLGTAHSFPLSDAFRFVRSRELDYTLQQAALRAAMFGVRWRWNAGRALAVLRRQRGKKIQPFLQRMRSDDLLAAVFPAQVGCQENATGPIEVPDHPLVQQTLRDCFSEVMDKERFRGLLERMERGEIRLHARGAVILFHRFDMGT